MSTPARDRTATHASTRRGRVIAVALVLVVLAAACDALPGDFTGDRKADLVVPRAWPPASWYTIRQHDAAVHRPGRATSPWRATTTATASGSRPSCAARRGSRVRWPSRSPTTPPACPPDLRRRRATCKDLRPTLLPVPGDYDGTGKTVPAYYDQVDGSWWIMGRSRPTQFGDPPDRRWHRGYDVPVPCRLRRRRQDRHRRVPPHRPHLPLPVEQDRPAGRPSRRPFPPATRPSCPVPADYDGVGPRRGGGQPTWPARTGTSPARPKPIATFAVVGSPDDYLPAPADYNGDGKAEPALVDAKSGVLVVRGPAPAAAGRIPHHLPHRPRCCPPQRS